MENKPDDLLPSTPGAVPAKPLNIPTPLESAVRIYVICVLQMMGDKAPPAKELYAQTLQQVARLEPRDLTEELLISQMLMTHARLMQITRVANAQQNYKWAEIYHTAADRAANTYRRQMESLENHRKPRRQRKTSITTIRTAHINAKQILNHHAAKNPQIDGQKETQIATAHPQDQTLAPEHGSDDL